MAVQKQTFAAIVCAPALAVPIPLPLLPGDGGAIPSLHAREAVSAFNVIRTPDVHMQPKAVREQIICVEGAYSDPVGAVVNQCGAVDEAQQLPHRTLPGEQLLRFHVLRQQTQSIVVC